jgi:CheY-like chemotaxis protein
MINKLSCILLVDDDEADNYIHQMIIESMDITERIVVSENGKEALEFLQNVDENLPELILLDINMPAINGWEFLKKYNDLKINQKESPVIFMLTTSENTKDKDIAIEIPNVKGFKNKPLTRDALNDIMKNYFNSGEN